jgi:choice-of-anchor A domain-containing protein
LANSIELLAHVGMAGQAVVNTNINLAPVFDGVNGLAHHIGALPQSGQTFVDSYGGPTVGIRLVGSNTSANVYDVSSQDIARAHSIGIHQPAGATAIVRVSGVVVNMKRFGAFAPGLRQSNIIWAMLGAETVTMGEIGVIGAVLAPRARVSFSNGLLTGQLFAKSFEGGGQINVNAFDGCVPAQVAGR